MAKITVGQFTLDTITDALEGPAQYLAEQGDALIAAITAGTDTVFNMTAHLSPNIETAILVRLQTDYAGWRGMRDFFAAHAPASALDRVLATLATAGDAGLSAREAASQIGLTIAEVVQAFKALRNEGRAEIAPAAGTEIPYAGVPLGTSSGHPTTQGPHVWPPGDEYRKGRHHHGNQ